MTPIQKRPLASQAPSLKRKSAGSNGGGDQQAQSSGLEIEAEQPVPERHDRTAVCRQGKPPKSLLTGQVRVASPSGQ